MTNTQNITITYVDYCNDTDYTSIDTSSIVIDQIETSVLRELDEVMAITGEAAVVLNHPSFVDYNNENICGTVSMVLSDTNDERVADILTFWYTYLSTPDPGAITVSPTLNSHVNQPEGYTVEMGLFLTAYTAIETTKTFTVVVMPCKIVDTVETFPHEDPYVYTIFGS